MIREPHSVREAQPQSETTIGMKRARKEEDRCPGNCEWQEINGRVFGIID